MIRADEARRISEESRWYKNASRTLLNAMREIDFAAERGDYSVDVIGMDDETAKALRSYGYKLKQKRVDGQWCWSADDYRVRVEECTEISWGCLDDGTRFN